ncbi:Nn.00g068510.m01.CDS01 [Neocucurbitaria sp. VM-36]
MSDTSKRPRRQRAVLSCNDCRRRKLKCDRELPCNRCKSRDIAAECAYGPEAHIAADIQERPLKIHRYSPARHASSVLEGELQTHADVCKPLDGSDNEVESDIPAKRRVEQLESQVALLKQHLSIQTRRVEDETLICLPSPNRDEFNQPSPLMGLLKGRKYATFFYGSSSPLSMIAHFPDLRDFMKSIYKDSTAQRLAQDMRAFQSRAQPMKPAYRVMSISNIRSLLPDRATVDILIRQYLDTFETTYRVLHIPSFEAAYDRYWNPDEPSDAEMDVLVLAILACTLCLPSVMSSLNYDCAPPRNINDINLSLDLKELPNSQQISTYTDASFLHYSMKTIELRTRLCAIVNSLKTSLSFPETLRYTDDIQRFLEAIPKWDHPGSLQARTLLVLQLRQFLVILHTSKVLNVDLRPSPERRYVIIAALEASAAQVDSHTHVLDRSIQTLCCTRSDYYSAALLICHVAYYASKAEDTVTAQVARTIFDQSLHKAFRLQEERAMRSGRGYRACWFLSAAVGLVGMQFDPSQSESVKIQAIDRVSRLLYKMLSLQDGPDEQSLASEVHLEDTVTAPMQVTTASNVTAEPLSVQEYTNAGLRLDAFDIGGMDDFWFFNDIPPLDFNDQAISEL